jgi:GNAT superfamily N-acetyltransferase
MARAGGPKTGILGRFRDDPAGVAFAAIHGPNAMIHAVWVPAALRRQKIAHGMMVCAAKWAQDIGAHRMSVLCLRHNLAANSLYASFGLEVVGRYHYRAK